MRINLPFDYIFCTLNASCWLLFPLFNGRWLALRRGDYKLRPCAFDERDRGMYAAWSLVIPEDIHNHTARGEGRGFKQLRQALFGDEWYKTATKEMLLDKSEVGFTSKINPFSVRFIKILFGITANREI